MSEGYGLKINDWVLAGTIAAALYFLYVTVVKPTAKVTNAVGDIAEAPAKVIGWEKNTLTDVYREISAPDWYANSSLNKDLTDLSNLFGINGAGKNQPSPITTAQKQAASNYGQKAINLAKAPAPYTPEGYAKATGTHVSNILGSKSNPAPNALNFNQKLMVSLVPSKGYYDFNKGR